MPQAIAPFAGVIDAWLRTDITLRASVIHERLAPEHGFTNSYQRVKVYVAGARPGIAAELEAGDENPLRGLHRRFEVVPGAQALCGKPHSASSSTPQTKRIFRSRPGGLTGT